MTLLETVMWLGATPLVEAATPTEETRKYGGRGGWEGLAYLGKMGKGLCFTLDDTDSRNSSRSLRPEDSEKALSRN